MDKVFNVELNANEVTSVIEWHEYEAAAAESVGAVEVERYHDQRIKELKALLAQQEQKVSK